MTAKEKAIDLLSKYFFIITTLPFTTTWIEIHRNDYRKSKECSLFAVDEIINTIEFMAESDEIDKLPYWNEVKKEIELL